MVRKGQVVQDIATYPKVRMVEQAMIDGSSAERLQELITRTRDWKTNATQPRAFCEITRIRQRRREFSHSRESFQQSERSERATFQKGLWCRRALALCILQFQRLRALSG